MLVVIWVLAGPVDGGAVADVTRCLCRSSWLRPSVQARERWCRNVVIAVRYAAVFGNYRFAAPPEAPWLRRQQQSGRRESACGDRGCR